MPRRTGERPQAASFPRRTAVELAAALGVHRNTIAAWRAQGAPTDLDEFAWRVWASAMATRSKGYDCPKDPEPVLWDLLSQAGVGDYRARQARHLPVLGIGEPPATGTLPAATKEPVPLNDGERKAKAEADAAEIKARDMQRASDLRDYRLIAVEDLHPLLDAWLAGVNDTIVARVQEVPARVTVSPEIQSTLKIELDTAIRNGQSAFANTMLDRLKMFISTLAGRP